MHPYEREREREKTSTSAQQQKDTSEWNYWNWDMYDQSFLTGLVRVQEDLHTESWSLRCFNKKKEKKKKNKSVCLNQIETYMNFRTWSFNFFKKEEKEMGGRNWIHKSGASRPLISREETDSSRWGKHDESDINITENRKFISFLDKPISPFWEGDLPIGGVLNFLDLKLNPPHLSLSPLYFLSWKKPTLLFGGGCVFIYN